MSAVTHFINVDLDIRSSEDLEPLADALKPATRMLQCERLDSGEWILVVELALDPATAEVGTADLLDVIAALPDQAQRLWRGARRRSFDIGIEAIDGPTWKTELTPATLRRIADHDAIVELTIYGPGGAQ
jgi:hypothetical protein